MRELANPCSTCGATECLGVECEEWRADFSDRWDRSCKVLRDHAWAQADNSGKASFRYCLPHEVKDPCENCVCREWCDTPCSLRLNWWNYRMALIRIAHRK